ncbi:MAG TPA: hypothetical protein VMO24_08670 [Woeseiaceae bacterium]|nr:hypothetical protein [Woeseiaceae bacterium]
MLHEFLISHRLDLIQQCRDKVSARFAPAGIPAAIDHGVPLFLGQLVDALALRPSANSEDDETDGYIPFPSEIGQSAALHGAELLRRGFTVDQVVHDYGDICQAITELAVKLDSPIDPDDFRILNGCLDNAIAGAVTSFVDTRESAANDLEDERRDHLTGLADQHRRLVEIAMQSFVAIKTGGLGVGGATGALLMHALTELHSLSEMPRSDGHEDDA